MILTFGDADKGPQRGWGLGLGILVRSAKRVRMVLQTNAEHPSLPLLLSSFLPLFPSPPLFLSSPPPYSSFLETGPAPPPELLIEKIIGISWSFLHIMFTGKVFNELTFVGDELCIMQMRYQYACM